MCGLVEVFFAQSTTPPAPTRICTTIEPAINAGVSFVPFGGGLVAKDVWESSRVAFRIGASSGNLTGDIAGGVASSNEAANCGC